MPDLLLDTHALIWCWSDDPALTPSARESVSDPSNTVFVSAASAWEIATKVRIGRLPEFESSLLRFDELVVASAMRHLPISYQHSLLAGGYKVDHRDPFDRMLAAQAEMESLVLVTKDPAFGQFPVQILW
ncbi:MAG: type II toxin-antitoxin system VapC family toxin [Acidimicrobiaceae bacterium]|nr:type II toxin-antitoxin system VapC family toxin [Acidimicrobiaceae bacterium]MDE0605676.1 type II toxin-antitoxin system VapC family toxin [Acidimicrobiaceae bacterium]